MIDEFGFIGGCLAYFIGFMLLGALAGAMVYVDEHNLWWYAGGGLLLICIIAFAIMYITQTPEERAYNKMISSMSVEELEQFQKKEQNRIYLEEKEAKEIAEIKRQIWEEERLKKRKEEEAIEKKRRQALYEKIKKEMLNPDKTSGEENE